MLFRNIPMNKTKIKLIAVYHKRNIYTILLSNGDVYSCKTTGNNFKVECCKTTNNNFNVEYCGNVSNRLNTTIGISWRNQVKSVKQAIKREIDYYVNNPPSNLIGIKLDSELYSSELKAYINFVINLAKLH